jgi:hypothetical protein
MTLHLDHSQKAQLLPNGAASKKDRPRQGANRSGAGSPSTQVRVREVYSMTDAVQTGTEWVPRFGMLEVPRERAELIRGLFDLAAFVADHREMPLPHLDGGIYPRGEDFAAEAAEVDRIAGSLGTSAEFRAGGGQYRAERMFGPVRVYALATTPENDAAYHAHMSYADNVQPDMQHDPVVAEAAGGAR